MMWSETQNDCIVFFCHTPIYYIVEIFIFDIVHCGMYKSKLVSVREFIWVWITILEIISVNVKVRHIWYMGKIQFFQRKIF